MTTTHPRIRLALDILELADAGGMPDTYKLTDARVGRALEVLNHAGESPPAEWEQIAKQRASAGAWSGQTGSGA
jgi:hypothetical protein